jgi:uncharacterized membrane protein
VNKRNYLYLAGFALLHALIFLVLFKTGIYRGFAENDISIPYLYGTRMALGDIPYRDFAVEYPPLALLFMLIPRLFGSYASTYILGFSIEILIFDLLAMLFISALSKRLNMELWKSLGIYTLAVLSIGPLLINRYDLIPAVIVLGAVYAFSRGHSNIAWALLAVGVMTKIYPAVIVPLFLIYDLVRRRYRRAVEGISSFALTIGLIALPFLIISPRGFLESFTYQTGRGLQIESVLSSILLLCQKLGFTTLTIEAASGGTDVVSPLATTLANITPAFVVTALLLVYWLYYRRQSQVCHSERSEESRGGEAPCITPDKCASPKEVSNNETASLISFTLLAILAFILSNKVLSPQFIIWLAPLIPLVTGRASRLSWLLFIAIGLMSYLIFPTGYLTLEEGDIRMIILLLARNAALIMLAFTVVSGFDSGTKQPLSLQRNE